MARPRSEGKWHLKDDYGWAGPFENFHSGEVPTTNHLPHEPPVEMQKKLLGGPKELLHYFRNAAKAHPATLGSDWRALATAFDRLSDACNSHKYGCGNVSPTLQAHWLGEYEHSIKQAATKGPVAAL